MTVWNSADKHANITLSESDIRATITSGSALGVRATTSKSSGKWCWELDTIIRSTRIIFGFANSSHVLTNYVGSQVHGWSCWPEDSKFYHNNVTTAIASTGHNSGDVFTCAVDFSAGSLSMWRNGVFIDTKYTNITGALFPMLSLWTAASARGRFKASQFIYPVPAGFTAWDDVPGEQRVLRADGKAVSISEGSMVGRPVSENVRGLNPGEARSLMSLGGLATLNSVGNAQVDNGAITYAKIQNVTTSRFLGRITAGAGVAEELTGANAATILAAYFATVAWTAPTLLNGWGNSVPTSDEVAGYWRDPITKFVFLKGTISGGTTTDGTVLFTLPSGFRPPAEQYPIVLSSATTWGWLTIFPNGNVTCHNLTTAGVILDNIVFRTQ